MIEYSIPSFLLNHGANISKLHHVDKAEIGCSWFLTNSYLSYLIPLPNASEHFQTEFLKHLDPDGISELNCLDRWFSSILYHTSPNFKESLVTHLEASKEDMLPTGILAFPDLCRELKAAGEFERGFFFEHICAFGPKDVLTAFIGAGVNMPQQPLERPKSGDPNMTLRFHTSTVAFKNVNTFGSLAAAGIGVTDFRVVLEVMSSRFILEGVQDRDFLEGFFSVWSPSSELRPLILAYWIQHLQENSMKIEDTHKAMFGTLIERGYCSFSSSTPPTQRIRRTKLYLGVEIAWQVCMVIKPRESGYVMRANGKCVDRNFPLRIGGGSSEEGRDGPREERVALLLYMLEQYHPFVDLELDRRWLPSTWEEHWLGFTPLMLAVVAGDFRLVILMVSNGATIAEPHGPQNLSTLDLARRNISWQHPRNWLGLPPSQLDDGWFESDKKISEETDKRIHNFLVKKSKHSQDLVHMPISKQISGGKLIR